MNNLLTKSLMVIAAGGIAIKAVKTVRYYKMNKETHDKVIEVAEDEK